MSVTIACGDSPRHARRPAHADGTAALPDSVAEELAGLAREALVANAEVRVHGDVEAALRRYPRAPRYRAAMWQAFLLSRYLRDVSSASGVRYARHDLSAEATEACRVGSTVRMLVRAHLRFDMAPVRPGESPPPYTAGETDHLFYFERPPDLGGGPGAREWVVAYHHEISLPELHDRTAAPRLLHPCA